MKPPDDNRDKSLKYFDLMKIYIICHLHSALTEGIQQMSKQQVAYSNAQVIDKLGKAFKNESVDNVPIPMRNCPDVPEFIDRLKTAQDVTRKHNIKFG